MSLYYDRDKGDFFVRPEVGESQPSGELPPEQTVLFAPEEGNQEAKITSHQIRGAKGASV